ncbi:sacsin N-terminal ATP-binding-like domain-containing protein [Yinghuangia seranimata]|uniref:sacsin N-terminal ATP-binding-like domain-containing protein n=1 Tax=Yinghuangia seranimata TaxID=408067 RepID=UPI00248D0452|nr:molecular chaperone Hsp90 [Yinghuangia seranimata]MDI2131242.1 molecular chaperone Hsp90 [Yinghuangia seranimata]
MGTEDIFATAGLRRAVLDAWAAQPARFREDANAEEELALGGYRDRLVVELAQNAADAAARGGVPGRLRLTLRDGVLAAANTGDPLHAEGVLALSTLRASAKRDEGPGTVGRFGVGFAAVLAVSDEPVVLSRTGGVRWSLREAQELAAGVPEIADEVLRRDGDVPVLRLPLPAEGTPPEDYDTVVVLPLRDVAAVDLATRLLDEIDDALLLTLSGLTEIVVETDAEIRTLTRRDEHGAVVVSDRGVETRWWVESAVGPLDAALLADRPTEERLRGVWSVLWAVPVDATGAPVPLSGGSVWRAGSAPDDAAGRPLSVRPVVHAPTASDEPLGLPALLIASFPLDSTRRHVAPGPLRDFLIARAAEVYASLLREWPTPFNRALLGLVPGLAPEGELDALLRRAVLERLAETPFLPTAGPNGADAAGTAAAEADPEAAADATSGTPHSAHAGLRPRDAVLLEGAGPGLVAALTPVLPGLLPSGLDKSPALRALGVRRLPLAEVVDQLAALDREPEWWHGLYTALDPADRDALGALPVPLVDGRLVRGPRHLLLPGPETPKPAVLAPLDLRIVHPDAVHALLERLGALPAAPRTVLADPAVREGVANADDHEDPDAFTDAVLELVRAAHLTAGEEPWLAELPLPDDRGELVPAGELMLPDGPLAALVDDGTLGVVDAAVVERWGADVLRAVGVLDTFGMVVEDDVVLDHDACDHDLDLEEDWLDDVLDHLPDPEVPPVLTNFTAVRDLDLVADDAWEEALDLLAAPPLRAAVVDPARVQLPDGGRAEIPSYTSWWLRGHPVLDGRPPAGLLAAGADPALHGLYEEVDSHLDDVFLRALGVRTTLAALLAEPGGPDELLDRLAKRSNEVGRDQLRLLYTALADVDMDRVDAPHEVRAVVAGRITVVEASSGAVADAPDLAALLSEDPAWALLPVRPDRATALAELLQLPLVSEVVPGTVLSEGLRHEVPDAVLAALAGAPTEYVEHDTLLVAGPDGTELEAEWRYVDGEVHATTFEGLARGLAWAAGEWHRRFEVAQLLSDPGLAPLLDAERDFDNPL